MERRIETLEELAVEARTLVGSRSPLSHATLITLSGELGAGKTTFTQQIALALGVEEHVTSPTFVLEKIYDLTGEVFKRLVHIDAYRLEKGADLTPLGFTALMSDPGNLIVLEWPERVADALPVADVAVCIQANPDGSRTLTYGKS